MKFWNLRNDPETPGDGTLDIDGEIAAERGWFTSEGAVIAKEFREALKGVRNVTVRINSPGGDVMAGAEIYSALREHSLNGLGRVTVIVTALAASAASVIAMAGDEIRMSPAAYMMIHNPWTVAMGDAHEMRKAAKTLDVIREGLIDVYERRTGKTRDELKRMLEAETWMSAGTCVQEGFADGILGEEMAGNTTTARPSSATGGGRAVACLMTNQAHDIAALTEGTNPTAAMELFRMWTGNTVGPAPEYAGDPDEEDPEETDPEEGPEDPEADPKEAEPEDPEADPEEAESGDRDEDEARKRDEIARRAAAAYAAAVAVWQNETEG